MCETRYTGDGVLPSPSGTLYYESMTLLIIITINPVVESIVETGTYKKFLANEKHR